MIETPVVVYKSYGGTVGFNADMIYLAYIVLPNGDYWGVRFNGATEEIARTKAISTWNKEKHKWNKIEPEKDWLTHSSDEVGLANADPWLDIRAQQRQECMEEGPVFKDKQHHLAGKVWMRHDVEGLKRVAMTEITMYEKQGYYRSGPRGK